METEEAFIIGEKEQSDITYLPYLVYLAQFIQIRTHHSLNYYFYLFFEYFHAIIFPKDQWKSWVCVLKKISASGKEEFSDQKISSVRFNSKLYCHLLYYPSRFISTTLKFYHDIIVSAGSLYWKTRRKFGTIDSTSWYCNIHRQELQRKHR